MVGYVCRRFATACAVVALIGACGAGDGDGDGTDDGADAGPGGDPTEVMFDPLRIVEIEIDIDEAAWDELRVQKRTIVDLLGGDCLSQPWERPFTYFPAAVTVDGQRVENVGVRKKGFFGSLDDVKPSLKIKFDEYVDGQRVSGMKRMTLNNARQDPSFINQCMGYAVFAEAGLVAPRCNFAHVTLNGEDMGLYVHVESIKKPFLARHFADPEGNMYEGTLSDFRYAFRNTFQRKTNELDPDQSDLDAVVDVVETARDDALLASIDPLIDRDQFIRFWATEVLIGHWDGYASNRNNFYIYRDPTTGRFQFIPWGIDAVLRTGPFGGGPESVVANGHLARRLYADPETRDQYLDALSDVLATAWDEDALLAEVDRMEALIEPIVVAYGAGDFAVEVDGAREFIETRRAVLEGELDDGPPVWDRPVTGPPCFEALGTFSGTFDTEYGSAGGNPFTFQATMDLVLDGAPVAFNLIGSVAGTSGDDPSEAVVQLIGQLPDGNYGLVFVSLARDRLVPGARLDIDWDQAFGALLYFVPGQDPTLLGYFAGGQISFQAGDDVAGAPVVGAIELTDLVSPPFAQALPERARRIPRFDLLQNAGIAR